MNTIRNILVPFDDNIRSIRALEYAAMFASGIGAKITALHDEIHRSYSDIRKIDLQIRGLEHSIYQHILDFAKENQIDFIVMRSHGLTQAGDWELHFKSTNAYKVLLDTPCPVFTFTQVPDHPRLKNIVVPIDLSEGSLFKAPFAIDLARRFQATLHLVAASEHSEDYPELNRQREKVQDKCTETSVLFKNAPIYTGTLPEAIFAYCDLHDVDLVIIMSRPGFRWSDLWMSPKAKRIITRSKVPVVSLRTDKPFSVGL